MVSNKSLDEYNIIAALLNDVHSSYGVVFNCRSLRLTLKKVESRLRSEGIGFLMKSLPRLGKAFDRACAGGPPLNAASLGFKPLPGSGLPIFMGEFFKEVLGADGVLLPFPCAQSVKVLRQILYCFYKYKLPFTDKQEQQVIDQFVKTEDDLVQRIPMFELITRAVATNSGRPMLRFNPHHQVSIARKARHLLSDVFAFFDPTHIYPSHGPGVVATKQELWEKYEWTNVSGRITKLYPYDAFFCASTGHVCDSYKAYIGLTDADLPARVILVPKDSRGPRLISCEPVDFQWIQQGLARAIVQLVETHHTTRYNVFFTDQETNRRGAYLGSMPEWGYATLDLKEASDRVSLDLVRLLFPPHICEYLECCRSLSTVLPDGRILNLRKFAPMGSSLCFPIMALTIWAILSAGSPDADTASRVAVYGDDVIVPTAHAENAIEQLESFGLLCNRDKSCTKGFFRESCGKDAFAGVDVTPVRFRTVWSSLPAADVYTSWIAYANSFYDKHYFETYDTIVSKLHSVYGDIPDEAMNLHVPSLRSVTPDRRPKRRRVNKSLQKLEWLVRDVKSPSVYKAASGWNSLLRYFAEHANLLNKVVGNNECYQAPVASFKQTGDPSRGTSRYLSGIPEAFSVGLYTRRRTSMLVRRWR
jgi:hypothetical protein